MEPMPACKYLLNDAFALIGCALYSVDIAMLACIRVQRYTFLTEKNGF